MTSRARFAKPDIAVDRLPDGTFRLRSRVPLADHPDTLYSALEHWAQAAPERPFLAERSGNGWRRISFTETRRISMAVAGYLRTHRIRSVMCLSENSIDQALLMFGAFRAGVPFCPVSPAYALLSRDFAKLGAIVSTVAPDLVLAAGLDRFTAARQAVDFGAATFLGDLATLDSGDPEVPPPVARTATAKLLFTSGSTGVPKGVITTHGMLTANQAMLGQIWPFLRERPPIFLDWLPWSHTFGGSQNLGLAATYGGTLYIDDGRPTPHGIARTVENLRSLSPTLHFNVPRGLDMLLPELERDPALRDHLFADLDLVFYAGASLPASLWQRIERLAMTATGDRPVLTTCYGATETAPLALAAHFPLERADTVGVPVPGVEMKLIPAGDKHEIAIRGPAVTPGYAGRPDLTGQAFDPEGYFLTGDAGRLADPGDPNRGIAFDGRLAEDFKLSSGTWVSAGALRLALISAGGSAISDLVIAGHDRSEIGILVFGPPDTGGQGIDVIEAIQTGLRRHNADNPRSSTRVARALVLTDPPSVDAGEITDKGYLNQRRILDCRGDWVAELFADPPGTDVIVID